MSVHSGKCADVWDWRQDNGAGVQQYHCHGGGNQSWKFVPQPDGTVHIVASHSGKCLEVGSESTENGGVMQQWDCVDGLPQQEWTVKPQGNAIALINKLSGKCLDIPDVGGVDDDDRPRCRSIRGDARGHHQHG